MKLFFKRHRYFIIILFVSVLLLLWGGLRFYQKSLSDIQFLTQENEALKERVISGESGGLLKEFRVYASWFNPEDNTFSGAVLMKPRTYSPTMKATILWDETEVAVPRDENLKNAFYWEWRLPATESHSVSAVTLTEADGTDSAVTNWTFYPWELMKTRVDAEVSASAVSFPPSKDSQRYSGNIKCYVSNYMGQPEATLLRIVNGAIAEEEPVRLIKKGAEYFAYCCFKTETGEDMKTEYVLRLRTESGVDVCHTALEIDGTYMDSFSFNTKTEVYNPESGEFLFAVP